jgi:hypothetical protein
MKTALSNCSFCTNPRRLGKCRSGFVGTHHCLSRFDSDDDDREDWLDPRFWDDPDNEDQFDPEPLDDEIYDDFDFESASEDEEIEPDELWNDVDWD